MKITILSLGKFEGSEHKKVYDQYLRRLKWKIELRELNVKGGKNFSSEKLKEKEGELILKALRPSSMLIALDENGRDVTSKNFAKLIDDFALRGQSDLTFVIGGADGLAKEVLQKANLKIALSKMTFPHLMVRSILMEQLYRAFTILEGHPYHRN